jgi:hypothetical protein
MPAEYDSEYGNVKYIETDNTVFITWKKFCRFDDYRKPTLFALNLLETHKNSNLVIDARNGFEDDEADIAWAFGTLLPAMSKTGCRTVVFITNVVNPIEEEIDLWTREFQKYFTVSKTNSYDSAINLLKG